jgi:hypothetical protein
LQVLASILVSAVMVGYKLTKFGKVVRTLHRRKELEEILGMLCHADEEVRETAAVMCAFEEALKIVVEEKAAVTTVKLTTAMTPKGSSQSGDQFSVHDLLATHGLKTPHSYKQKRRSTISSPRGGSRSGSVVVPTPLPIIEDSLAEGDVPASEHPSELNQINVEDNLSPITSASTNTKANTQVAHSVCPVGMRRLPALLRLGVIARLEA